MTTISRITATPPIATPTIAPVEREDFLDELELEFVFEFEPEPEPDPEFELPAVDEVAVETVKTGEAVVIVVIPPSASVLVTVLVNAPGTVTTVATVPPPAGVPDVAIRDEATAWSRGSQIPA